MTKPFYERLRKYFLKVGEVLRGEADAGSIFPNTSDIGLSRELIYAEFLKQHAPSKCNVFLGGFLFSGEGEESKQLDLIISTDTTPRYNFLNPDGKGKSFSPVEGCLGVASIKSTLDKNQLFDALEGIASIPLTQPLGNRINPTLKVEGYEAWPYKIVYASNGLSAETILGHLNDFYCLNPNIPMGRRPEIIHVAGQYAIVKIASNMAIINVSGAEPPTIEVGKYHIFSTNPDIQAIVWILDDLQKKATASSHIIFNYSQIVNNIHN